MWRNWEAAQKIALRFVLLYIVISISWVLISDWLLQDYLQNANWISTAKGWLFILLSGLLYYKLIQRMTKDTIENEANYRLIVENVSDLIVVADRDGHIKYASPSHEILLGYESEEYEGKKLYDFIQMEDNSEIQGWFQNEIMAKKEIKVEYYLKSKEGNQVLVEGKVVPVASENGTVEKMVLLAHDITKRKQFEKQLIESEERYRKLVEYSPETIFIHIDGKIVYVNNAGMRLAGVQHIEEVMGKNILDFVVPEDLEYAKNQIRKVEEMGETKLHDYQITRIDGTRLFVEALAFQTTYQENKAVQVIIRDITERKRAEERVRYLAYYDSLTGLPNRNFLFDYLNELLIAIKKDKQPIAVMFLDLDRFKMINDTLGHSYGDFLLQQVASRLKECLPKDSMIARYGGDEYVIVLQEKQLEAISRLSDRIIDKLAEPFFLRDRQMFISPSIGISMYPKNGDAAERLIKNADAAMYLAKEKGKNNYQFYTSSLNDRNSSKLELENGLRNAIKKHEFTLFYQPQIDLNTNKIIGLEALLRWKHPKYGFVSPAEFIPIAEETGLIVSIGKWALETACNQHKQWKEKGFSPMSIAVNVSALQFRHKDFVKTIEQIISNTKCRAGYLELEMTESVMQHLGETTTIMNELKEIGVNLSIDDFGTGYSSLNYLRHFPIDTLKIDKSFVDEINNGKNGEIIVKTIIDLGNSLGFQVIAEGVENEQQASFLRQNNCHVGQGYFLSKPLPADQIEILFSLA
ncbi:bifunctional diguanylate cyclase/phosphodiesterase [Niallia sp. NCCP-28]|uniref:bifunctional diguanylate cyclase/phosphodiesterase n=1 Tax=Niallia sp. NCCP-28 TaxID=2934712 RepID=UPI00207F1A3D|nr:bifunctional diguanylate cyclase/phosphodiesterase [Niallia sp. NCCP-28]GKU81973.1 GGDEF domain-containing protein [Niallia sp. NCCP-28]